MVVETASLAAGKAIGQRAARLWLAGRHAETERNSELVDLIQLRFRDKLSQRRIERQLEDIADMIAERIYTMCRFEYPGLQENDKEAAVLAAATTFTSADLSDDAIFDADADAIKLASQIRRSLPPPDLSLGELALRLYEVIIDDGCDCIIRIIRQLPSFGSRALIELIGKSSQMSADVQLILARTPIRSLDAPAGTSDDDEFRRRYLEQVSTNLDSIELFGVRVDNFRPRTTLSVAYISLSVSAPEDPNSGFMMTPDRTGMSKISEWRKDKLSSQAATRVEAALAQSRLTLLRGEAGSGKSTLLRWLAITAARSSFTSDLVKWNGCVPFLIKLRSYADGAFPTPEMFLSGVADNIVGLMPTGWVHRQLSSGRALLLIDGIDELPSSRRRDVRPWLRTLVNNSSIKVVVTSRPAAAGADWLSAEGFTGSFLERMGPADIRSLIRHWHIAIRESGSIPCRPEELVGYEAALLARLEAAPHLQVLASSPLLAAMLCALNLDRDSQLPRDRMGIYAAVLELLLERRDFERHIPSFLDISLEREQKIQILQDLAWRLSTTSRTELPKELVIRRVESKLRTMPKVTAQPETVLTHLLQRSGVLREPSMGRIDFVHRTIQEYLTAQQAADDGDMQPIIDNANRDQWYQIVVMAAGHANMPLRNELISGLLARAENEPRYARRMKLLVASCLETLPAISEELRAKVTSCLEDLVPPRDFSSAQSLSLVGEPVLSQLSTSLEGLTEAAAKSTVRTAYLVNGPNALNLLSKYGNDSRRAVQEELVRGWEYFDPNVYAARVLAKTDFVNGSISINSHDVLPGLKYLHGISDFRFNPEEIISDLEFLQGMPKLEHLKMSFVGIPDLSPLARYSSNLVTLDLALSSETNLSALSNLSKLKVLALSVSKIRSLEFLKDLKLLRLDLHLLRNLSDYSPIAAQADLVELLLAGADGLTTLSQLGPLGRFRALGLRDNSLNCTLEELTAEAPQLTELYLRNSKWVSNLLPLQALDLAKLELWQCKDVRDLAPLSAMTNLYWLDLDATAVEDLRPLAGLKKLNYLYLSGCSGISDLSPLAELPDLTRIHVDNIADGTDITPLAGNRKLIIRGDSSTIGTQAFGKRFVL